MPLRLILCNNPSLQTLSKAFEIYRNTPCTSRDGLQSKALYVSCVTAISCWTHESPEINLINGKKEDCFLHSHKKRKDSLECSLDRVLLAAELELTKILIPRLPQHTSNVNIENTGKSEWSKTTVFFMCDQLFGALILLNFIILVLIFF